MRKFVIIIFLLIIIGVPIVILTPSSIGCLSSEQANILLSYCGTIIGGFITIIGVALTLDAQKKQWIKDKQVEVKPVLDAKFTEIPNTESTIHQQEVMIRFYSGYKCKKLNMNNGSSWVGLFPKYLNIVNVGRGELYDLKLIDFASIETDSHDYSVAFKVDQKEMDNQIFLLNEHIITYPIVIMPIQNVENKSVLDSFNVKTTFIFQFKDSYKNIYKQSVDVSFTCNYSANCYDIDYFNAIIHPPILFKDDYILSRERNKV